MCKLTEEAKTVSVKGKDGQWYACTPMVADVRGGKAVIYVNAAGEEVKREPLARYRAREERKKRKKGGAVSPVKGAVSDETIAEIVEALVDDITDRRGLKHEWNAIDEDIQDEIKAKWVTIIKSKLGK